MGESLIYGLLVVLFGLVPWIHTGRKNPLTSKGLITICTINFFTGWISGYFLMPFFYGPFFGMTTTILTFGTLNAFVARLAEDTITRGTMVFGGFVVVSACISIAGSEMLRADEYHDSRAQAREVIRARRQ